MHPELFPESEVAADERVLVGTASWTDKTLIACGRFYPKTASSAEARLRFYASRFPIVEVDSSYYAMPAAATSQLWAERTPARFTFNVKAFRLFTGHQTSPVVLPKDIQQELRSTKKFVYYKDLPEPLRDEMWRRFRESLQPLANAGKLKLVHFQFPPWMLSNRDSHDHVRHCVERMQGHTLSVEFRHRTWFDGERHTASTLDFERELGVVHTVVDGPQGFANSVPAVWASTHPRFGLVRLHGRNASTWNIKSESSSASDRFNYDYSREEIGDLAREIRRLAKQLEQTHVVFNNNMEDQGQRNAVSMMEALQALAPG